MSVWTTLAGVGSTLAGVAGAVIPGAAPIAAPISAGLAGLANSSSQADANASNLAVANANNAFNQQMWDKNNAYNTPLAQRQRMQAAGYNPYLTSGQVSTGSAQAMPVASPVQPMQSVHFGDAGQNAVNTALNTALNIATVKKAQADADLARSNADQAAAQTSNLKAQTPFVAPRAQADITSVNLQNKLVEAFGSTRAAAEIANIASETSLNQSKKLATQQDIDYTAAQILKTYAERNNIQMSTWQMRKLLPLTSNLLKAQTSQAAANAYNSYQQGNYTSTQNHYYSTKLFQDLSESRSRTKKNLYDAQGLNLGAVHIPGWSQAGEWFDQALDNFSPFKIIKHSMHLLGK